MLCAMIGGTDTTPSPSPNVCLILCVLPHNWHARVVKELRSHVITLFTLIEWLYSKKEKEEKEKAAVWTDMRFEYASRIRIGKSHINFTSQRSLVRGLEIPRMSSSRDPKCYQSQSVLLPVEPKALVYCQCICVERVPNIENIYNVKDQVVPPAPTQFWDLRIRKKEKKMQIESAEAFKRWSIINHCKEK